MDRERLGVEKNDAIGRTVATRGSRLAVEKNDAIALRSRASSTPE
ncbi:MAG: hypothetical protein AAF936_01190 [Pseudomonadota bacterium]